MIIIDIKDARAVAKREKGRLKVFFASLFRVDIDRRVDEVIAERIADELRRREIEAEVRIESGAVRHMIHSFMSRKDTPP